ncbi:hypothetical protein ACIRNI_05890 [Streptomyces sp. NPDC093546]|uniref:hypothetical protein n=1 Tax=Streptomyces sp. NPDC093546 TaxID=3366040 RepID=UPI00380B4A96
MNAQRLVRNAAVAAAGCAAALALTGCGGGADPGDGRGKTDGGVSPAPSPGTPSPAASPATPTAAPAPPPALEGAWLGVTDGKAVNLTVKKGHAVVLAESRLCQGFAKDAGQGVVSLTVKCRDGGTDRARGTAREAAGGKLVVTWDGGTTDTLTRATVGENVPTSLPSLPPQP